MSSDDWTTPADIPAGVSSRATMNLQLPQNMLALFNAIAGDQQATGEVIHFHKNGTFANRPAATSAMVGRTYLCTDFGVEYICLPNAYAASPTHVWYPSRHIPALCDHFSEDFAARPHGTIAADVPAWHAAEGWHVSATQVTDTALIPSGPVSLL